MVEIKNKKLILEILHDMEDFAKMKGIQCKPIYIAGGSACILADILERATIDIDVIDINYAANIGRLFKLLGDYDVLDLALTTISHNFEERAVQLNDFTYLDIFILSREDIITTKIGRYSHKDKSDIEALLPKSDKSILLNLIKNIIKRNDLSSRIKEEFIRNVHLFRSDFNV